MPAARTAHLPDRARLAGAVHGVRQGRPARTVATGGPDDAVLDLAADPFESVHDAYSRLSDLEALFRARGDDRGAFLVVYARVTDAVGQAIADGVFADPEWTTAYLVAFADLYRQALYAYEVDDSDALPDAWKVAFDAAAEGEALVAQNVLLGVNAHVNYDLALALTEVGIDPDRDKKYDDHCTVNDILRHLVDEVQENVAETYAPGIATVDESLGRLDEAVSYGTLVEGRDSAWRSAVALRSRFSVRRRLSRWLLRVSSTGFAYLLLAPTRNGTLQETLHGVEHQR